MSINTLKQKIFLVAFTLVGFIALQIKLTHLAGSKVNFTLFDSFAPMAGSFLGGLWGALSVLAMQLANMIFHGANLLDTASIIRLIPMLFAVWYFSKKTKLNLIVPILAIIAFNLHPIGRTVWYYSLFWLIPIIGYMFQDKSLVARSLGATFMAHAVGGALWIYAFNLPKAVWVGLIPVVVAERILFAIGIAASYVVMRKLVNILMQKGWLRNIKLPSAIKVSGPALEQ